MKCRECICCKKGWFPSKPDAYICVGVKEPFVIDNIDVECPEYPEYRSKTVKDISVKDAVEHYKHGISHDIFSEPVTSYAKMAVKALEKQIPKIVVRDGYDESDDICCPHCNIYIGSNEYVWDDFYNREWKPIYCQECGQAMIWE